MAAESYIDSILVQNAGLKSINEIAEDTGLDPEEVARRTQAIFERVMLTPDQLAAKNVYLYQQIANVQIERFKHADDENIARLGNTAAGALGRLQNAIEKMMELQGKDTTERDIAMGHVIALSVEKAADKVYEKLQTRQIESVSEVQEAIITELTEIAVEFDGPE